MPLILFFYLVRHFLKAIAVVTLVISFTIIAVELVEFLRKSTSANLPFGTILFIVVSKLPYILQEIYTFLMFTAAIYSFFQLSRQNELTIMKTSGISVWQFLLPYLTTSFVLGVIVLTILNPISSALLTYGEKAKPSTAHNGVATTLLASGFWLMDKSIAQDSYVIIRADHLLVEQDQAELSAPSFTYINYSYELVKKIKAKKAILTQNQWQMFDAVEYEPYKQNVKHPRYAVHTNVRLEELQQSFKDPKYTSIWNLPYAISILQLSGYHAKQYIAYFYKTLSKPFTTLAMLFVAAIFSLRPMRISNPTHLILASLLIVFAMYFITEIAFAILLNTYLLAPAITTVLVIISVNVLGMLLLQRYKD